VGYESADWSERALDLAPRGRACSRALFDGAGELAASVHNFWWYGVALMEAAATRAVHRGHAEAARAFVDVLDHWDRVGDWTQQWLNLRYVVRLLVRLGADEVAVVLHHTLVAAGKPSALDAERLAPLLDGPGGAEFTVAAKRGTSLSPSGGGVARPVEPASVPLILAGVAPTDLTSGGAWTWRSRPGAPPAT